MTDIALVEMTVETLAALLDLVRVDNLVAYLVELRGITKVFY
jgi:hypothetical protein